MKKHKGVRSKAGFTLIELMIVVAIIGVLAAVAVPKFASLLRKSNEGATKGNLGSLRSALTIYYADNEGWFPMDVWSTNSTVLADTLIPKYISVIPEAYPAGHHGGSNNVRVHWAISGAHMHDGNGWIYDGMLDMDKFWGEILVSCSHTDTKSNNWTNY